MFVINNLDTFNISQTISMTGVPWLASTTGEMIHLQTKFTIAILGMTWLNVAPLGISLFRTVVMTIATICIAHKVDTTTTTRMSIPTVVIPPILVMAHMLGMIE
jgi:hypothetical protein